MGKKYLETKGNSLESSILGLWQEAAKKEEELTPKQKKIDVDGDGEIEASDLAKLRKKGAKKEEVELDEVFNGTKKDIRKIARATDNALKKRSAQIQKMLKSQTNEKGRGLTDFEFDHISDEGDAIAAELVYRKRGGKDPISDDIPPHLKKFVNEEVDLDEDSLGDFQDFARSYGGGDEIYVVTQGKDSNSLKVIGIEKDPNKAKKIRDRAKGARASLYGQMKSSQKVLKLKIGDPVSFEDSKNKLSFIEEADLDEGKMSQLHQHIKDKKSPEEIAKMMKLDVKTVKALMAGYMSSSYHESYEIGTDEYREHTQSITPGQEITDYQRFKVESMKEALAKVWGLDEKLEEVEEKDLTKKVKGSTMTMTGKKSDEIDTKPEIDKEK